jgi:Fur family peroxide stress response transcriptional regulator
MRKSDPKPESRSAARRSQQRLAHLTAVAREAGVKLTHQRLEIFRELAGTDEHPDAETLFRAVQQRMPTVSLDTVYRTLWKLHDLGLVTTLGPRGDGVRFDANLDPHHHYVCVQCGLVRDFDSKELSGLRVPDTVTQLGSIVDAHVEVRGLCARCQRGQRASRKPATDPKTKTETNARARKRSTS